MTINIYKLTFLATIILLDAISSINNETIALSTRDIIELKNSIIQYKDDIEKLNSEINNIDDLIEKIIEIKNEYKEKIDKLSPEIKILKEQINFIENEINNLNIIKKDYINNALNENNINSNNILRIFDSIINSFEKIENNIKEAKI
jgi:chromosome segregation ATPase